MAVRAIGRTRRAEFLGTAVTALDNASIDVRREAAFAVAHIGSADRSTHAAALDALRQRLTREPDPFVTASLAESIGRLAFPSIASVDGAAGDLAAAWARADAGPARAVVSVGVGRGAEAMARRVRTLAGTGSDSPALVALLESLIDRHAPPTRGTVASQDVLDRRVRRLATSGLMTLRALSAARRVAAAGDADAQVRRLAVLDLASSARRLGRGCRGRVQRRVRARTACGRLAARVAPAAARGSRGQRSSCGGPVGCPRRAGRGACVPLCLREPARRAADGRELARARARARRSGTYRCRGRASLRGSRRVV